MGKTGLRRITSHWNLNISDGKPLFRHKKKSGSYDIPDTNPQTDTNTLQIKLRKRAEGASNHRTSCPPKRGL